MHTFLFEEGLWTAKGAYYDETMSPASLMGEMRIIHRPDAWLNEGRMILERDGKKIAVENRYQVIPLAAGSDFTAWESVNPTLGILRGHFTVVGNAILSSCTSADSRYRGMEFFLQESVDQYINRGTLFSSSGKISSWELTLTRRVRT